MAVRLRGDRPLRGEVRPTSDKSVSHRALILGAVAHGETVVRSLNPGADVGSTIACLRALGVVVESAEDAVRIVGRGGVLRCPTGVLDCGNSGTSMRLLAGVLATQEFTATLDGDPSLRARPMRRIAVPLRGLGARVEGPDNGDHAPLVVTGPVRRGGSFSTDVASAQVKSAILLAGAVSGKRVRVEEPGPSRDHTERMLTAFGVECRHGQGFALVDPATPAGLTGTAVTVGGDPSAAALLAAAAVVVPASAVRLREVMLNPGRLGFAAALRRMGVGLQTTQVGTWGGEEVGHLDVSAPEGLAPTVVQREEIPSLVDEVPALAAVAAFADGTTTFEGVAELRRKESDRLESLVALLAAFGIDARADADRLEVRGGRPSLRTGLPATADHRILMASAVLSLGASARGGSIPAELDTGIAAVSDPAFFDHLQELDGAARD